MKKIILMLPSKLILYAGIGLLLVTSIFYACKKRDIVEIPPNLNDRFTLKSDTKIQNVSFAIKSASLRSYLSGVADLDLNTISLKKFNETDNMEMFEIYYKNTKDKGLYIMHFINSNHYQVMGLEHKNNPETNTDLIILSDYEGNPINVQEYKNNKSLGFASNLRLKEINSTLPTRERLMVVDPNGGGGESCYACINRHYQDSKNKCDADFTCDIGCSVSGITCNALWLAAATAVCVSSGPMPRPCGVFQD